MIWELVGLAATLCVLASYLPQILRSYRTREMDDISLSYLSIIAVGIFLWLMYGITYRTASSYGPTRSSCRLHCRWS